MGNIENIRDKVNSEALWAIVGREDSWAFILYCIYWFCYFFLSTVLTGQTLGMGLAGVKLADCRTGLGVSGYQAFLRTLLLPVSVTFVPSLVLVGVVRRDGRMIHDIVSGTGVVYRWNARMAGLREKAERAEEKAAVKRRVLARQVSVRSINVDDESMPSIEIRLADGPIKKEQ